MFVYVACALARALDITSTVIEIQSLDGTSKRIAWAQIGPACVPVDSFHDAPLGYMGPHGDNKLVKQHVPQHCFSLVFLFEILHIDFL